MEQIEKIVRATGMILNIQKNEQFIPDYVLQFVKREFDLTYEEARKIRDIVQSDDMRYLWERVNDAFGERDWMTGKIT
jgi:hypothetical protein